MPGFEVSCVPQKRVPSPLSIVKAPQLLCITCITCIKVKLSSYHLKGWHFIETFFQFQATSCRTCARRTCFSPSTAKLRSGASAWPRRYRSIRTEQLWIIGLSRILRCPGTCRTPARSSEETKTTTTRSLLAPLSISFSRRSFIGRPRKT